MHFILGEEGGRRVAHSAGIGRRKGKLRKRHLLLLMGGEQKRGVAGGPRGREGGGAPR